MPPFISLCLIVKNEEPYLARCLKSFHGVGDELIVVDTGSTDRTVEIAREHGARVEHFQWCDDFGKAKNFARDLASGEWIIMPDGDEYLGPEGVGPRLVEMLEQVPDHIDKILIEQRTLLDDEVLTLLVDRVFRNRPELRWRYRIHEAIEVPAERTAMTREFYLLHENALKRREDMRVGPEREQMYLRALAADVEDHPVDPRPAFYLASTLYGAEQYEESLAAYERYFDLSRGGEAARRAVAYRDAAAAAGALGDRARQRTYLFRSLEQDWRPAETYVALADLAQEHANPDEAIHWLTVATTCSAPATGAFAFSAAYGPEPWNRLAALHRDRGDERQARACEARARELARRKARPKKKKKRSAKRRR